jgi:hypothetical protein
MKKNVVALSVLVSSIAVICMSTSAQAQVTPNPGTPPQVTPNPAPTPGTPPQVENPAPPQVIRAEPTGRNTIGPSISIGNGVTVGIDSKFGIAENVSLRPFIYFGNGGTDFGTALTYDINLKNTGNTNKITPFIGGSVDIRSGSGVGVTTASLVAGAEYELTESIQLKAAINVPLNSSQGQSTNLTAGAGFRF